MAKFKAGDRVVRTGDTYHGIIKGSTYTVRDYYEGHLRLEGVYGMWTTDRFELVEAAKEEKCMKKFNIGDTVRLIGDYSSHGFTVGETCKIVGINSYNYSVENDKGVEWYVLAEDMEPCENKKMQQFDMKKHPWFIRIENEDQYNLAEEWLKEHYGDSCGVRYLHSLKVLTNTLTTGEVCSYIMWGADDSCDADPYYEIKLNFKTSIIIDSAEFPEIETEQEQRIRELKETISLAQKQIEEIQKEMK